MVLTENTKATAPTGTYGPMFSARDSGLRLMNRIASTTEQNT